MLRLTSFHKFYRERRREFDYEFEFDGEFLTDSILMYIGDNKFMVVDSQGSKPRQLYTILSLSFEDLENREITPLNEEVIFDSKCRLVDSTQLYQGGERQK